jgi:hypothetical protein
LTSWSAAASVISVKLLEQRQRGCVHRLLRRFEVRAGARVDLLLREVGIEGEAELLAPQRVAQPEVAGRALQEVVLEPGAVRFQRRYRRRAGGRELRFRARHLARMRQLSRIS